MGTVVWSTIVHYSPQCLHHILEMVCASCINIFRSCRVQDIGTFHTYASALSGVELIKGVGQYARP